MSEKIVSIINGLPALLPLKPASEKEITDAELRLMCPFAKEFRAYLSTFGAIMADGIELTGIAKSEHRNVVSVTQKERQLNPLVPNTMYVVENPRIDGIIIWQDNDGNIYQTLPGTKPKKIAESLSEYIQDHK